MKRNDIRKRKLKQKKGGFGLSKDPKALVNLFIKQVPLPEPIKNMVLSLVDIEGTFDTIETIVDESKKLEGELKKGNDNKVGIFKQLGNFLEAIRDFILKIYETILTNVIITTFVSQIKEEMKTIADIAKQYSMSMYKKHGKN